VERGQATNKKQLNWIPKPAKPPRQTRKHNNSNPMVLIPLGWLGGVGPFSSARPIPAKPKSGQHRRVLKTDKSTPFLHLGFSCVKKKKRKENFAAEEKPAVNAQTRRRAQ
jgi:hypothetical protein